MANGFGIEDELSRLRAELGLPPEQQDDGGLWDTIFQPVKGIIGATGNVGGQLAGLTNPEAYKAAAEQLRTDLNVTQGSSLFEKGEALPGLGDVAAHMLPESVTGSVVGEVAGPVARMVANALGDPTTYTPYILGKLGQGALKAIPAYRAARASTAGKVTSGVMTAADEAAEIQKAIATGSGIQKAGAWMGQHALPIDRAMMVGGLAYAPELAEGVGGAASESWRLMKEEQYGEAVKVGASGALLAGLAGLIGKGVFNTRRADAMLDASVRKTNPAVADAKAAAERGDLPVDPDPVLDMVPPFGGDQVSPEMRAMINEAQGVQAPVEATGRPEAGFPVGQPGVEVPPGPLVGPLGPLTPEDLAQQALRQGIAGRGEGVTRPGRPDADATLPLGGGPDATLPPTRQVPEPEGVTATPLEPGAPEVQAAPQRVRLPDGTEVDLPLSAEQFASLTPEQILELREQVRATQRAEVAREGDVLPAVEPPGPIIEGSEKVPGVTKARAPIAEKARKAGPTEGEASPLSRGPVGHLEPEDVAALERGLDPKQRAQLDEDLRALAEDSAEPAGVKEGIEKAIDELTIRHGAKPERLALALRTMQAELGRLRNLGRMRKAILESPDLAKQVREASEAYDYVAEHRERISELRQRGDASPLKPEETKEISAYKAQQEILAESPLSKEIIEAAGGKGVDPDEAVEFVRAAIKALDEGDVEAVSTHLADVVNDSMLAIGAMPEFDPRIIRTLGDINTRLTGDDVLPDRAEGNMKATEEMWKGITRGKKYGLEGEELTMPQVLEKFLESEPNEKAALAKFSTFMERIIKQGGRSREKGIIRKGYTIKETPIAEVIKDADDLDLRYRDTKIDREDLQQYAHSREAGRTDAEIADGLGVKQEELTGLNTVYNTMKSRTKQKVRREEPLGTTEEGVVVEQPAAKAGQEAPGSATLREAGEDTLSIIERKAEKTVDEIIDAAPDSDFRYGKEKRKISREELKKYTEAWRDGLRGKALGEFMWGKDSPNKRTQLGKVFNKVLGLEEGNKQLITEVNTAADAFFNNFLNTKKISDLDIDDEFTTAFARLKTAVSTATDAQLFGRGKAKGTASPVWEKLREWAGLPAEQHPGKAAILAGVEARLKAHLPGEAVTKLKRADLPVLREELAVKATATRTANRLGLLAGSEVVEQARGKKLPKGQRDLDSIAKPKHVKTTGALAERYPPGTYSGYDAHGGGKVYFTAGEKAGGETVTVLATKGEGGLSEFLSEAARRGTKHVEIPDQLADGLKNEVGALRRIGVLKKPGTKTANATSVMYPVDPGPPRTAAQVTDAAAIAESTRNWYAYLKNKVETNGWQDSLSKVAARTVGKGKGYDDLLKRIAVDAATGRNLFRLDARLGMEPYGVVRQLMSSTYLHGGTKIFDDFLGVQSALAKVKKDFGIDPDVQPLYLTRGAHNGVFAIGTDRQGRALVMKINSHAPKQLFLEDRVPQSKSFMLPTLRAGTTKEGWNYRIERRGVPMVIERPGIQIPTDMPAAVGVQYVKHQLAIRKLEDAGIVKVLDDGPGQWVVVDGKPYLADRGAVAPMRSPYWNWMAQQDALRRDADHLTPSQARARDTQYSDAIDNPNNGAVNFDGVHSADYQRRLGEATGGIDGELGGILDELGGMARKLEGAEDVSVSFGGVTASPYLRGLYADGKVYVNPMEVLYRHMDDPRAAAEELVGTLIHETLHDAILGHTGAFHSLVDQLRFIADAEGQMAKWVDQVEAGFKKRAAAYDDLVPEYREAAYNAVSSGRESWRGEASLRRDAVHPAEGGPARAADQRVEGAADLEAGVSPRLQRGLDVPEGGGRETGPLGEAPVDRGADARQAAEGPEGPPGGQEAGRRIAAEETGRGGGETVASGYEALKELVDAKVAIPTVMSRSVELSFKVARRIGEGPDGPANLAKLAEGKPARGDIWSRYNLDQVEGVSNEAKAAVTLWSQMTAGIPELSRHFDADTPRGWDELDVEVKKLLDLKSKKDLFNLIKKGKHGLTDREVVLAKILGADMIKNVETTSAQLADAQLKLAEGKGSIEDVNLANARHNTAAMHFAEGMPTVIDSLSGVGRALAAARKVARAQHPEAAMIQDMRAGLVERLRQQYPSAEEASKAANELMNLWALVRSGETNPLTGKRYDARDWAEAYRNAYKFSRFDKFLEAYKAFLLGWKSRAANIASNTLVQGVRELERTVGIGLEKAHAKLTGRKAERFWGELKLNGAIMKHWGTSALPDWYAAFKDQLAMRPDDVTLDHVGSMMEDLGHQVGAIKGKTGEFVRFMFKGMSAEDALFKRMSQLQHYYKTVYRNIRGGKAGWETRPGEDAYAATARYVQDIEEQWLKKMKGDGPDVQKLKKYADIHDEGFAIAREETFQKELPAFMKNFQAGLRKPGGKPFQMIFPFVRTPYNIAVETLRRTPKGFYDVARDWNKVAAPERMDLLARPLVGTTVGMFLINEAMQGNITGGGPIDPIEEANLRETGWRAYSLKWGNNYLGYQRFEPISSIVGMAADVAEGVKRGDFTTVERTTTRLFSLITENLTNKTFLSGLEGLSTAMADPQRSAGRWIKQMQTSLVPNTIGPIPFGHLAQAVDPIYRQSEPMSWDAFGTKVPFLSKTLAPQYTPTGELRKRPGTGLERLVSPVVRTKERTDPTAMAARLLDQIGSPPTPPKKYTFIRGVKVYYTAEQRAALAAAQSQATKIIGTRLVKDPGFMRLWDNEDVAPVGAKTKKAVVKSLYDKYRRNVVSRFRADLMRKARQHVGGEYRP